MGMDGLHKNWIAYVSDALIFKLNQIEAKGFQKRIWKGWPVVNTENFISKCIMDVISFETKETKEELSSLSKDSEFACWLFLWLINTAFHSY